MYLELADGLPPHTMSQPNADLLEHMIAIPTDTGELVWVREDQLDDVPDEVLYQILQQQPHMAGIKDWFARIRKRRQERRAKRHQRKMEKMKLRTQRQKQRQGMFSNIAGKIGSIFGGGQDGGQPPQQRDIFPQVTGGASIGVSQWWQNPLVIGGLVLTAGTIIYFATRDKK